MGRKKPAVYSVLSVMSAEPMTSPELVVLRRGVRRSGTAPLKLALLELVMADRVSLERRRKLVRSEPVLVPRVDPDAVSLRTFALAADLQERLRGAPEALRDLRCLPYGHGPPPDGTSSDDLLLLDAPEALRDLRCLPEGYDPPPD